MNWYKLKKMSSPIIETNPSDLYYSEIGHDFGEGFTKELKPYILWFIDEDWNIHTQRISPRIATHDDWGRAEGKVLDLEYSIAKGRYDPEQHIVSIGDIQTRGLPKEDVIRNIQFILDDAFNSPAIINFNMNVS